MNSQTIAIPVPDDFHLPATVLSHGWHECHPMAWVSGAECFQTIERVGDRLHRVNVQQPAVRRKKNGIAVRVESFDDGPANDAAELVERVRAMLSIERDLAEFYELCGEHKMLADVPSIGAGRLIRSSSMTENILKFLFSTNVNWTQAVKMINRLAQLGPHIPHYRSQNAWPTPKEILRAGREYLIDICRVGYRADSILAFCRSVDGDQTDPERFVAMANDSGVSSDEIMAELKSIKGIGPASAAGLLSLLGRYDRLSIDSATIAHAAAIHFGGRKPTPREVEKVYEPFGKWKNLVYWCESWMHWHTARAILARRNAKE